MNSDFRDLLRLFADNGVRYLIVGGYAVMEYSEPRYTKDLDLWVSADAENAQRIYGALREFGAPIGNLTPNDFASEGYFYAMGVPPVRVDILMSLPGLTFEAAWPNRVVSAFEDTPVLFVGKDDLIALKRASGRREDLRDVEALTGKPRRPKRPSQ